MSIVFADCITPLPIECNDQRRPRYELFQEVFYRLLIRNSRDFQMKIPRKFQSQTQLTLIKGFMLFFNVPLKLNNIGWCCALCRGARSAGFQKCASLKDLMRFFHCWLRYRGATVLFDCQQAVECHISQGLSHYSSTYAKDFAYFIFAQFDPRLEAMFVHGI